MERVFQLPSSTSTITTETEASATNHIYFKSSAELCSPLAAQEIFYLDSSVLYMSLHAEDDYPCMIMICMLTSNVSYNTPTVFTGTVKEKGIGEGANTNFNYPLPRGTQDSDYCATLRKAIEDILRFDPVYLLVRLSCTPVCIRGDTDRMVFQPWC